MREAVGAASGPPQVESEGRGQIGKVAWGASFWPDLYESGLSVPMNGRLRYFCW